MSVRCIKYHECRWKGCPHYKKHDAFNIKDTKILCDKEKTLCMFFKNVICIPVKERIKHVRSTKAKV